MTRPRLLGHPGLREADTDYGEVADRYAVIAVAT
jgi:hypothetical protein